MEIINLLPLIYSKFIVFMLIFTRISALFSTFTLFKAKYLNPRTIVALAALISMCVLLTLHPAQPTVEVYSLQMLIQMGVQFFIGFVIGLILNIIFDIFICLGQIISMQIGLSMASIFDPRYGTITNITDFYVIMATLIFLSLNGHLQIIKLLVDTFTIVPLYKNDISTHFLYDIISYSSIIFSGAISICLSLVIAVLITNIALAVMSKFAPQINIFSIGINLTMMMGLLILYLTFNLYTEAFINVITNGLTFLEDEVHKMVTMHVR